MNVVPINISHQDSLRLNVLLKQDLKAIKVDEANMIIFALTSRGEAKIQLNPNCRADRYLRWVRETLSMHALGSTRGYPVFLEGWTRMGQAREESLAGMLMLGEPEAVVAVAHTPGLTVEYAKYAWWALPTIEVAQCLLGHSQVVSSNLAKILVEFLLEFLPFEADSKVLITSVRLILQTGLLDKDEILALWAKTNRKSAYYAGFLQAVPDDLPVHQPAHTRFDDFNQDAQKIIQKNNGYALLLKRLISSSGQTYLTTLGGALEKVSDQQVMLSLVESIQDYFYESDLPPAQETANYKNLSFNALDFKTLDLKALGFKVTNLDQLKLTLDKILIDKKNVQLQELLLVAPRFEALVVAMVALSLIKVDILNPLFAQTDAVGSLMRRKLEPLNSVIKGYIKQLCDE